MIDKGGSGRRKENQNSVAEREILFSGLKLFERIGLIRSVYK
jgi:hypothetical protein